MGYALLSTVVVKQWSQPSDDGTRSPSAGDVLRACVRKTVAMRVLAFAGRCVRIGKEKHRGSNCRLKDKLVLRRRYTVGILCMLKILSLNQQRHDVAPQTRSNEGCVCAQWLFLARGHLFFVFVVHCLDVPACEAVRLVHSCKLGKRGASK